MRLSIDRLSRLGRLLFTILMGVVWSGWTGNSRAAEPASREVERADPQANIDRLQRCLKALEAARKDIPRDTFDIAAVAKAAGETPEMLTTWVRDHTGWVPYHGSLRGPLGVLMDRKGNSLDRAMLLAEMLRSTGRVSRLAHAELAPDLIEKVRDAAAYAAKIPLVSQAPVNRASLDKEIVQPYGTPFGINPAGMKRAAEDILTHAQRFAEDTAQRTEEQSSLLSALIWPQGLPKPNGPAADVPDPARDADVQKALGDHWWVQVQDGQAWTDLDPLFSAAAVAVRPPAAQTIDWQPKDGRWPLESELCHEVEVRVIVEKWQSDRLTEITVLKQPLRPSELIGQHVSLVHVAQSWPDKLDLFSEADPGAKVKSLTVGQREWLPALRVGTVSYYEGTFTDTGTINPKADLALFRKTGKAIGNVTGEVANALDPTEPVAASPGVLTAEWIEYDIRSPGQRPRTIRRQVFDLVGPAARAGKGPIPKPVIDNKARLQRGLSLVGQTEILLLACQISPEFLTELTCQKFLLMSDELMNLWRAKDNQAIKAAGDTLLAASPLPSRLYQLAVVRYAQNPHQSDVYFDRPNILTLHQFLRDDADKGVLFCVGIDIVANEIAVRPRVVAGQAAQIRFVQGVLDTNIETLLMDQDAKAANVADQMALKPQAKDWLVIRGRDDPAWQNAAVSRDVRARVDADLAAGYTIVLSSDAKVIEATAAGGWWRVNPQTGQTLGIGRDGWGATMAEYAVLGLVVFAACLLGAGAAGKGATATSPVPRRTLIACAIATIGVVAGAVASSAAVTIALMVAGGAVGAGAGYGL